MKSFLKWILFVICAGATAGFLIAAIIYPPLWMKLVFGASALVFGILTYLIVKYWHYELFEKR